jgi:hypothetical protein
MTLELPQRRQFATRDDFAAAVTASFADLYARYEGEPVSHLAPDWAQEVGCYSIALPLTVALNDGAAPHGISSFIKQAIEMKKSSIGRIARVERDGMWIVFFEAK